MTDEQCTYEEQDPEGGVAKCKRPGDHVGVHLVVRQDGKTYFDTPSWALIGFPIQPGEFKMVYGDDLSYRPSPRL